MNPADIHGKRIAMVAWGEKPDGTDDVVVFAGTAEWDGARLIVNGGPDSFSFQVQDDWIGRLQPVAPDLKETLLDAEYSFSVTIGPLPDGANLDEFVRTGIKWPSDDES